MKNLYIHYTNKVSSNCSNQFIFQSENETNIIESTTSNNSQQQKSLTEIEDKFLEIKRVGEKNNEDEEKYNQTQEDPDKMLDNIPTKTGDIVVEKTQNEINEKMEYSMDMCITILKGIRTADLSIISNMEIAEKAFNIGLKYLNLTRGSIDSFQWMVNLDTDGALGKKTIGKIIELLNNVKSLSFDKFKKATDENKIKMTRNIIRFFDFEKAKPYIKEIIKGNNIKLKETLIYILSAIGGKWENEAVKNIMMQGLKSKNNEFKTQAFDRLAYIGAKWEDEDVKNILKQRMKSNNKNVESNTLRILGTLGATCEDKDVRNYIKQKLESKKPQIKRLAITFLPSFGLTWDNKEVKTIIKKAMESGNSRLIGAVFRAFKGFGVTFEDKIVKQYVEQRMNYMINNNKNLKSSGDYFMEINNMFSLLPSLGISWENKMIKDYVKFSIQVGFVSAVMNLLIKFDVKWDDEIVEILRKKIMNEKPIDKNNINKFLELARTLK